LAGDKGVADYKYGVSLLDEEEKEKDQFEYRPGIPLYEQFDNQQETLSRQTQKEEDLLEGTLTFGDRLNQAREAIGLGLSNIPGTLYNTFLDNQLRFREGLFKQSTGEIPLTRHGTSTFGEGAAGRLGSYRMDNFLREAQEEAKDNYAKMSPYERSEFNKEHISFLKDNNEV